MDVQLQELIEKIKSDGVASAEKQAASIIEEAEKKAASIVSNAEEKAKTIVEAAQQKEEQMVQSGKDALVQAGRDLILNLEERLTSLFNTVIESEVGQVLSGEVLESAVVRIISSWANDEAGKVDVLLPREEYQALEAALRKKLSDKLAEGIEIKPSSDLRAGFRISMKDGSAYYDFTAAEIADALSESLNPRLAEALQKAAAG